MSLELLFYVCVNNVLFIHLLILQNPLSEKQEFWKNAAALEYSYSIVID